MPTIFCGISCPPYSILWITFVQVIARMTNTVKKHEFLLPFARLFTRSERDVFDSIPFQSSESYGDEDFPALASPTTWSAEAVAVIAEAACQAVPADLRANEENTVPSWLWRHQSRSTRREAEADLRNIFNRVVGSAAAKAWKLGLFTSEKHARIFYDETRYALMQRHIAIAPEVLAPLGLSWAYGLEETAKPAARHSAPDHQLLSNAAIDAMIGKSQGAASSSLWKKLFALHGAGVSSVTVRLSDIAADWHSSAPRPARAAIDVMALRHNDGSINIDALRQAARLTVILLDLHECQDVTIGLANLAPLLMAFGLAYDSDAGRAMAASLAALVTAECGATSAELAALRGMSDEFSATRDAVMRSLRNHRRAVYGDGNDYEKLSVLPAPLPLNNCPDLSLVAEAQRRWNEALERARAFGLRATQATDMTPSPTLSVLMTSASQGLEPMQSLSLLRPDEDEGTRVVLHPAVSEALTRLDYPRAAVAAATQHIVGMRSIRKAPGLNAASLKARGLNDVALEKIESYLPCVDRLRLAITPWIIGIDYCRTQLKIPARTLESPRFDLLRHLGFSDAEVKAADLSCYGHGTARNAKSLNLRHRPLFACSAEISPEARIRMAAAVQSFISGDTGLIARLPALQSVERGAETTLAAWRCGLKSLTVVFDPALAAKPIPPTAARRLKASAQPQVKPVSAPSRRPTAKNAPILAAQKSSSARRGAR